MRRYGQYCNNIDIKEVLKSQLREQKADPDYVDKDAQTATGKTLSPANVGIEDVHIYFDSSYKEQDSQITNGIFNYNIYNLNYGVDITKCFEMRVGSFYIPRPFYDVSNTDPYYFKRVHMEITNLPFTQGVKAYEFRYHFEFEVTNVDNYRVLLTPTRDLLYYPAPINTISSVAIQFTVPPYFNPIVFPPDTIDAVTVAGTSNVTVSGVDSLEIFGVGAGAAVPPIEIYFIIPPPSNQELSNAGYYVLTIANVIVPAKAMILTLSCPNFSATVGCRLLISRNRIAFPMRFTCIRNAPTNYTASVHL